MELQHWVPAHTSVSTMVGGTHLLDTPPWFLVWLMSYMKSLIGGAYDPNCSLPPGGDRDVLASTRVDFIFTDACTAVCVCFSSKNEQKYVKNKVWPTPQTQSRKWLGITGKKFSKAFLQYICFLNLVKQMAISSAAQMLILLYNKQIYWRVLKPLWCSTGAAPVGCGYTGKKFYWLRRAQHNIRHDKTK